MHSAEVLWNCDSGFAENRYTRTHLWRFDGGVEVAASASPSIVPLPLSATDAVDPEEAYIAALSACHMLWFLDIAQRAGHVVRAYRDHAKGALVTTDGCTWMPRIDLNIHVAWDGPGPAHAAHLDLHHTAHRACFLANSVRTEIVTNLLETPE
jgi:organic hydroperoxide reductase OsmC/OhrA